MAFPLRNSSVRCVAIIGGGKLESRVGDMMSVSSLIKIPHLVQNIWGAGTDTRTCISPNLMIIPANETTSNFNSQRKSSTSLADIIDSCLVSSTAFSYFADCVASNGENADHSGRAV
jgi:hypothetical protein